MAENLLLSFERPMPLCLNSPLVENHWVVANRNLVKSNLDEFITSLQFMSIHMYSTILCAVTNRYEPTVCVSHTMRRKLANGISKGNKKKKRKNEKRKKSEFKKSRSVPYSIENSKFHYGLKFGSPSRCAINWFFSDYYLWILYGVVFT
ncbi:unnamed protein product [Rhizophagus irregularis]|nr:unnamed protein product [Rhizophagus irregularis]